MQGERTCIDRIISIFRCQSKPFQPKASKTPPTYQVRELRKDGDDVGSIVSPFGAGVALKMELSQRPVAGKVRHGGQAAQPDEVESQIQTLQRLAPGQALDRAQIVDRQVQILQILQNKAAKPVRINITAPSAKRWLPEQECALLATSD